MGSAEQPENHGSANAADIEQICTWNGEPLPAQDVLLHQLIEDQVRSRPDAPAIDSWDGKLSYAELDDTASALAVKLASAGVGPEVIVPLCFGKTKFMIVAMFAVLKAGGAFCPLEPGQPHAITSEIIERVGARICLCSDTCAELMKKIAPKQNVLVVDAGSLEPDSKEARFETPALTGGNTAYVFFTSGSTGVPKGCINTHGACCVSFKEQARAMNMGPDTRTLHRASFCFDSCLCETMVALVAGGCICVPTEAATHDNMMKVIADCRASWALFLPSHLGQIDRLAVPTLTTVALGVEVMSDYHIAQWTKQARLLNAYGLTECAVVSTVASNVVPGSNPRNIGLPIGVHAWIVDPNDHDRLVPIGSMGELALSGPALGKGYLHDKTQTEKAYIPSPAWMPKKFSIVESRLFKTGDLVRYDNDGSIICIGRKANLSIHNGEPVIMHEVEYFLQSAMPSAAQFVCEIIDVPALESSTPALLAFVGFRQDLSGNIVQLSGEDSASIAEIMAGRPPQSLKENGAPYPDKCWPTIFVPCFPLPKKWSGKANRIELRDAVGGFSKEQIENWRRGWQDGLQFEQPKDVQKVWVLASS